VLAIAGAALLTVAWTRRWPAPESALLVADAIGLGAYAIVGAQVVERAGLPAASGVLLGAVTGAAGGAVRDVLCAEIPYVLRPRQPVRERRARRGRHVLRPRAPRRRPRRGRRRRGARHRHGAARVDPLAAAAPGLPARARRAPEPLFSERATARLTGEHPAVLLDPAPPREP
jgi:hypothetical protein